LLSIHNYLHRWNLREKLNQPRLNAYNFAVFLFWPTAGGTASRGRLSVDSVLLKKTCAAIFRLPKSANV